MSSHYAANHLHADWDADAKAAGAAKLEAAEQEAGHYFNRATVLQKAAYDLTMSDLRGLEAPRYDRARAAAKRLWDETTAAASDLYHRSVAEIMADGEISEAMDEAWTALVANPMPVLVTEAA